MTILPSKNYQKFQKPQGAKSSDSREEENLKDFDYLKEFENDEKAYDIQYYNDAIFLQRGTKEEIRYPYLVSGFLNCCPIENDLKGLSPLQIANIYLHKDMQPVHGNKTREYFERILVDTGSITVQHMEKPNKEFAFSKLIIKRILPASNWGLPLFQSRKLENFQGIPYYNYYDYVKAWDNIFLYENSARKHSWWIKFTLDDENQKIPNWYFSFFFSWGASPMIFPKDIKNIWRKFYKENNHLENISAILQFVNHYQVPWIIRWDYNLENQQFDKIETKMTATILKRRILLKWWPKENFFDEGKTYDKRGILSLKPSANIMKNMNAQTPSHDTLLKELLLKMNKESVNSLYKEVFGKSYADNEEIPLTSTSENERRLVVKEQQNYEETEAMDEDEDDSDFDLEKYQEAQDPNAE